MMTLDEAIKRYTGNAKFERTHGNLQGCLEFGQLAEWLKDYKRLLKQEPTIQDKQAESEKYQKAFDDGYANGYAQARFDYEQEPICDRDCEHCTWTECPIEPCTDAVSRQAVLEKQYRIDDSATLSTRDVVNVDDIEELPSVNPQPCDDAISRDAVLEIICRETEWYDIRTQINELPSVNPQPCDEAISRILQRMWNCRGKHTTSIDKVKMEQIIRDELLSVTQKSGKWVEKYHEVFKYYCDKCGTGSDLRTNYCPNCGAKMESEEV